jgi:hypothetical protein
MRAIPAAVLAQREAGRTVVERHLLWIVARPLGGGSVADGWWTGREDRQIAVVDPETGGTVSRAYRAGGGLIAVEPVTHARGLEIVPVRIRVSPIDAAVETQVRGYSVRFAPLELHRLWLDPDTRQALAPAQVWFVGHLNEAPLVTPAAGGEASLELTAVPLTRALTLGNPEPLSDAVQQRRGGDRFLRYVGRAGGREIPWGTETREGGG